MEVFAYVFHPQASVCLEKCLTYWWTVDRLWHQSTTETCSPDMRTACKQTQNEMEERKNKMAQRYDRYIIHNKLIYCIWQPRLTSHPLQNHPIIHFSQHDSITQRMHFLRRDATYMSIQVKIIGIFSRLLRVEAKSWGKNIHNAKERSHGFPRACVPNDAVHVAFYFKN